MAESTLRGVQIGAESICQTGTGYALIKPQEQRQSHAAVGKRHVSARPCSRRRAVLGRYAVCRLPSHQKTNG
jgi:hypothetical protein